MKFSKVLLILTISLDQYFIVSSEDNDIMRDSPKLIESRNFKVETHHTQTKDNYRVTMFRIINPRLSQEERSNMPIAFLMNSGFANSDLYLIGAEGQLESDGIYRENGRAIVTDCDPKNNGTTGITIGFVLATCGYDVWLGNDRATGYSFGQFNITTLDPIFWNFSFVQIGRYDLPAMIDYVLLNTKQEKLNYISISKGTTDMFVLLSEQPEFANKIQRFIALSAAVTLLDTSPLLKIISPFVSRLNQKSFPLFSSNDQTRTKIINDLNGLACNQLTDYCLSTLIESFRILIELSHFNHSRVGVLLSHEPMTFSWFTAVHYTQIISSKRFQYFDYGCSKNRLIYNQNNCQPPLVPLKNIKLKKIAIFYSKGDQFCRPTDVEELEKLLSVPVWKKIQMPDYVLHADYILHSPIAMKVNAYILNLLKE